MRRKLTVEKPTFILMFFSSVISSYSLSQSQPFLNPKFHLFDFDEFENEEMMMDSINEVTNEFLSTNTDPDNALVIQLIHKVKG